MSARFVTASFFDGFFRSERGDFLLSGVRLRAIMMPSIFEIHHSRIGADHLIDKMLIELSAFPVFQIDQVESHHITSKIDGTIIARSRTPDNKKSPLSGRRNLSKK